MRVLQSLLLLGTVSGANAACVHGYANADGTGDVFDFGPGWFVCNVCAHNEVADGHFPNDHISKIVVDEGCSATVYQHSRDHKLAASAAEGWIKTFGPGSYSAPGDFGDHDVSGIEVMQPTDAPTDAPVNTAPVEAPPKGVVVCTPNCKCWGSDGCSINSRSQCEFLAIQAGQQFYEYDDSRGCCSKTFVFGPEHGTEGAKKDATSRFAGCPDGTKQTVHPWQVFAIDPLVILTKAPTFGLLTNAPKKDEAIIVEPDAGGASGDPFTTDAAGNRVQFFLPVGRDVSLLSCKSFELLGRVMSSGITGDHQQWFDRFLVRIAGQDKLSVEIQNKQVKQTLANESAQIDIDDVHNDVAMEGNMSPRNSTKGQPLSLIKVAIAVDNALVNIPTSFHEIAHDGITVDVSQTNKGESVHFATTHVSLDITTALAAKFTTKHLQKLYRHLDITFVKLEKKVCSAGILAEVWGLAPMSEATTAMLQPQ